MHVLEGIGASPGVAIGEAMVIDYRGQRVPCRFISRRAVEGELQRLDAAVEAAAADIERNRAAISQQLGDQYGAIFAAHEQMLRDPKLQEDLRKLIVEKRYSAAFAARQTLRRYANMLKNLDNQYLAERAHDIDDIENTLLRHLLNEGLQNLSELASPAVVLAHTLTPSDTAHLDPANVLGFVTQTGGAGSHTSIVAEALGIPAVVGVGRFPEDIDSGDLVVVDGNLGRVIFQPDEGILARYRQEAEEHRQRAVKLSQFDALPAETLDGTRIQLGANIEFPYEIEACLTHGADGIGLFRTEFLYLASPEAPTEEIHFQTYCDAARRLAPRPVVIRTVDLGADKLVGTSLISPEPNPFLGLRSIRLSLRQPEVFRTQLRAVLRASVQGNIRLMFPLISTIDELRQAKTALAEAMKELEADGVPFDRNLPVGIMVETPAAVMMLDRLLLEVDFVSIGTNDLIQYTLAVDRSNNAVGHLYQGSDPAVLRMIEMTVRAANRDSVPATLCGQMSGSPSYVPLLLGLGLRGLSIPPGALPEIKRVVRTIAIGHCEEIARRALEMDSAEQVESFAKEELRKATCES